MDLINFTNYNIAFFNFISFLAGGYFILTNFEDLNKKNGIQDCYNIKNAIPAIICAQPIIVLFVSTAEPVYTACTLRNWACLLTPAR